MAAVLYCTNKRDIRSKDPYFIIPKMVGPTLENVHDIALSSFKSSSKLQGCCGLIVNATGAIPYKFYRGKMDFTNKEKEEDDNITISIDTDDENIKEKKFEGKLSEFKYPFEVDPTSVLQQSSEVDPTSVLQQSSEVDKSGGSDGLKGGKKKNRKSNKYLNKRKRSTTLKRR